MPQLRQLRSVKQSVYEEKISGRGRSRRMGRRRGSDRCHDSQGRGQAHVRDWLGQMRRVLLRRAVLAIPLRIVKKRKASHPT